MVRGIEKKEIIETPVAIGNLAVKEVSNGPTLIFGENNTIQKATDNGTLRDFIKTSSQDCIYELIGSEEGFFKITSDREPEIIRTGHQELPFELGSSVTFNVEYTNFENGKRYYKIKIPKGYTWDGASIPKWLQYFVGKNDEPEFAVASLVHDVICEDHSLIENNRALSSGIFKGLLRANGVGEIKASIMAFSVDVFQFFCRNWKVPEVFKGFSRVAHA